MAENVYEAMFLFDSNRFARDPAVLPAEVEKMITSEGGEVLVSRLWEDRKLAYPIRGHRKGTYWLIYFRGPSGSIAPLNRQCEIHDQVLRQLILKIHPHLVDAILDHAKGEPAQEKTEEKPQGKPEEKTEEKTEETKEVAAVVTEETSS